MKIAIFDLDGCISDDRRRRKYLPSGAAKSSADYDKYHEGGGSDPSMNSYALTTAMKQLECTHFLFITARPEKYRGATADWLKALLLETELFSHAQLSRLYNTTYDPLSFSDAHFAVKLLMRSEAYELMPSEVYKVKAFIDYLGKEAWSWVGVTFDDLPRVCAAYVEAGVSSLDVMLLDEKGLLNYDTFLDNEAESELDDTYAQPESESVGLGFDFEIERDEDGNAHVDIHLKEDAPAGLDLRELIAEQMGDPLSVLSQALSQTDLEINEEIRAARRAAEGEAYRKQQQNQPKTAAEILREAATTYEVRNEEYGENYRMVGPVMELLFPDGVDRVLLGDARFHLFELVVVKLTRLASTHLEHRDSARDAAVYCAMIEAEILEEEANG